MKKPESIARRLSHVSGNETSAKPIGITEIVEGAQCTAAYIAQMTGELANLAQWRPFSEFGSSSCQGPARSRALVAAKPMNAGHFPTFKCLASSWSGSRECLAKARCRRAARTLGRFQISRNRKAALDLYFIAFS
jgi:hypothetical protein